MVFVPIGSAEARESQSETTDSQAYDAFLKGWSLLQRGGADGSAAAVPYFEQAIALDPEYGRAYAALALTYQSAIEQVWWQRFGLTYGEAEDKTEEYLALALERPTSLAHRVNAQVHLGLGDIDTAAAEAKRAIELEPTTQMAIWHWPRYWFQRESMRRPSTP